ncbi:hypothetical protein GCM10027360_26370 [Amycolatopsis echigonensis]
MPESAGRYSVRVEFREFDGKKVQRPSLDLEDVRAESAGFRGEFAYDLASLVGADQAGVVGEGEVVRSMVKQVNLAGATLDPLDMRDSVFAGIDFSRAKLPRATAQRIELVDCRAAGVQLTLLQASDVYAEDCQFDYGIIRIDRVKHAVAFSGCSFRETLLAGDLSNVVFVDCVFAGTEFEATAAAGCDLRGSTFEGVKGLLSLRGARISSEQALSAAAAIAAESGLIVRD